MQVTKSIFREYDIRGIYPEEINEDVKSVSWNQIKNKLTTMKGEELNLTDKESYSRSQQAIDYVDRVGSYYKLLSAHACIAPKDQLTFF